MELFKVAWDILDTTDDEISDQEAMESIADCSVPSFLEAPKNTEFNQKLKIWKSWNQKLKPHRSNSQMDKWTY